MMRTASARCLALGGLMCLLGACGGGGSGGGGSGGGGSGASTAGSSNAGSSSTASWTPGVFALASQFAARCAAPRSGTDPYTNQRYPDIQGTLLDENNWLRSWSDELYLWYAEIVDQNPALFSTTDAYFQVLKTSAVTASGRSKDRFHFSYVTSQWEALSSSDIDVGYGAYLELLSPTPPRTVVVAYTEPNTAAVASGANLARGTQILSVDGVSINAADSNGVATLNAGLFPSALGETHTFVVQDAGASTTRTVTLTSANITYTPVPTTETLTASDGASVGYILFNDQLGSSEAGMVNAMATLKAAGVTDLMLDLRYNGGGYLDIASEVAYMIAGHAGQVFETQQFNSKNPTTNPVTGGAITPVLLPSLTEGFSVTAGQSLPTLNLSRVFVLTGTDTCSASEAIINALRGVGVQVIQIGSTTCGKPYGFYPQDNCGTTYFSIEFDDVNAQGFGAYADGFTPMNSGNPYAAGVPGCSVADDFSNPLGSASEARLAAALGYRLNNVCPVATGLGGEASVQAQSGAAASADAGASTLALTRPPWRQLGLRTVANPPRTAAD